MRKVIEMAAQHKEDVSFQSLSESGVVDMSDDKHEGPSSIKYRNADDEFENLSYPPPWKFEKYFLGGYSQNRLLKFKKPKSMYTAINLFAGK